MIPDHECDAVLAKDLVDLLHEPARVAELEAVASPRQAFESRFEALVVTMEVAWKLPEDRPELAGGDQRLDPLIETLDSRTHVGEPLHVGQIAARLDGEEEVV